jgi:hypothetical protein
MLLFLKITFTLDDGAEVDVEASRLRRRRRAFVGQIGQIGVLSEPSLSSCRSQLARLPVKALLRYLPGLPLKLCQVKLYSSAGLASLELWEGYTWRTLCLILEWQRGYVPQLRYWKVGINLELLLRSLASPWAPKHVVDLLSFF